MHGHGSKPNLCSFPDCERSLPGNGFPRRYNLYDHMKRVHDYTPSTVTPDEASPTMASAAPPKRPGNRKRRSTAASDEVSEKRQKTIAIKASADVPVVPQKDLRAEQINELRSEWNQRHVLTAQHLQNLQSPFDMQYYTQLGEDLGVLQKIAVKIMELGG